MLANPEAVELSLLEALAAAPSEGVPEGRVEAMTLALYADRALRTSIELEVDVDDCVPHCDQLAHALFTAYGRGLVERAGAKWRLGPIGQATLERAGLTPTAAAKTVAAEALAMPVAEVLTEVAEKLSSRYAMIAAGDGQPVRV